MYQHQLQVQQQQQQQLDSLQKQIVRVFEQTQNTQTEAVRADGYPVQDPLAARPTADQPSKPAEALPPRIHIAEKHPIVQQQGYDLGKMWRPTEGPLTGAQQGGSVLTPEQQWASLKEAHFKEKYELLEQEELDEATEIQKQKGLRKVEQKLYRQQQTS